MLSRLRVRLAALVSRRRHDADLDEELRYHLEREIERNIARGLSPADARDAARRAFGNVTAATEQARDTMRWRWLEEFRQDVHYAWRSFRRAPAFVFTVVATIALGLGLLSAAFTFFDAYVLRPFAVRDPYSLYSLGWSSTDGRGHRFTWPQYEHLRATRGPLSDHIAFTLLETRLRGHPAMGGLVSGNYFSTLGVGAALGRTLVPSDAESPGANDVIVLSHRTWQTVFGGDSAVIGSRVNVNGTMLSVVGVAREGFGGLTNTPFDFWVPITMIGATGPTPTLFSAGAPEGVYIISRLTPGASVGAASSMLLSWMRGETADRPRDDRVGGVYLTSRATSMPRSRKVVMIFAPVVVAFLLVMLIACANVANIMLARGMARQREIGVRLALGAGRGRIIRQLLTEAVLLSVPAGVLGFLVSRGVITGSLRVMFATVPPAYASHLRVVPLDADARILVFILGGAIVAAIAFGLAPALQATRPNIVQASRGDFDTQFRPSRLRNALVVAQITFSALLLVCAGVLLASARRAQRTDTGIRTRDVVQIDLNPKMRAASLEALRRAVSVRALASSSATPLDGPFNDISLRAGNRPAERAKYDIVSPEYFGVLDLPVVRGRGFTNEEATSRSPVAIVSQSAARRLWPGGDALGHTITIPETQRDYEPLAVYRSAQVIGVVADALPGWIGESPATPVVYYPQPLDANVTQVLVRTAGDEARARMAVERSLAAVDSGAVLEMHTLGESLALQVYPFRAMYWVALAIGGIALLITVIGVYGVMSYVVAQRRREFGIRLALGASRERLIGLVMRQSLRLAVVGAAVGVVLALGVSKLLASVIEVVNTFDVFGYAIGTFVVVASCALAAYTPSRRAAAANPVEALRADS